MPTPTRSGKRQLCQRPSEPADQLPLGAYSAHPDAATAIGATWSASYDTNGAVLCRAATSATTCAGTQTGAQLRYDNEGQLSTWQNTPSSPTSTDSFLYDGEGRRVEQVATASGTTTTTTYVGALEEITTTGSTTTTTAYYGGLALSITQSFNSTLSYTLSDGLGSVSEAVTLDGTVAATQLYAPYGAVRYQNGTLPGTRAYTGQRADAVTGLDYYNARYYDPIAGQFTSADTMLAGGLNRYAYVGGNPESLVDPTGHRPSFCDQPTCSPAVAGAPAGGAGVQTMNPNQTQQQTGASGGGGGFNPGPAVIALIVSFFASQAMESGLTQYQISLIQHRGLTNQSPSASSSSAPTYPGLTNEGTDGFSTHQNNDQTSENDASPAQHETESVPATDTSGAGARKGNGGGTPLDILNQYRSDPSVGKHRTVAYAVYSIGGVSDEVAAVSGDGIRKNFLALPAETLFTTEPVVWDRTFDAEHIILENIAARFAGNSQLEGFIYMMVGNDYVCWSCAGVVRQFRAMFGDGIKIWIDLGGRP